MATTFSPDAAHALEALLRTFLDPVLRNISPYGCPMGAEGDVSRQMEAVGWVYNKHICSEFPHLTSMDWEELCKRASQERPKMLRFITTTAQERPCPLTITEVKVKNACEAAKFLHNTQNSVENCLVTKISVCVLNPRLDKCVMALGASTMGVWSLIEKEKPVQFTEGDRIRDSEEDCVFETISEHTGIKSHVLKIGDSFLVADDMNRPGCSTKLYIVFSSGTFDLSSRVKLESIEWVPLSVAFSQVDGTLIEVTDDTVVQTTSAVHYCRLRPFCPLIKKWLASHNEMKAKWRMNPEKNLGCCKSNGIQQAMLLPCKSIVPMVSEPSVKQSPCDGELVVNREDMEPTSICDHSQNQRVPVDPSDNGITNPMDEDMKPTSIYDHSQNRRAPVDPSDNGVTNPTDEDMKPTSICDLVDPSDNGMMNPTDEDKLTLHLQTLSKQSLAFDTVMPPNALICCDPQSTPTSVLPDGMISQNDAYVQAEVAAVADAPAGNTQKYQICQDFVEICKEFAPLKNKISKYSSETEKAKERTSPLRIQENKNPNASVRATESFEDHIIDKDMSAFKLNKALHIVWKRRKTMCKELRDLHSRVNALHEKITGCDSDLETLIGGGQNGLQLAIKICKGDSDECLDEDDKEEASLPLEVLRNGEQQSSRKRNFQMLTNSTEELKEVCARNDWLPPSYGVFKSTNHRGDVKYIGKVKLKNEIFELSETGELSDTVKAAKLSAAGHMLSTLHLVRARNGML